MASPDASSVSPCRGVVCGTTGGRKLRLMCDDGVLLLPEGESRPDGEVMEYDSTAEGIVAGETRLRDDCFCSTGRKELFATCVGRAVPKWLSMDMRLEVSLFGASANGLLLDVALVLP